MTTYSIAQATNATDRQVFGAGDTYVIETPDTDPPFVVAVAGSTESAQAIADALNAAE